MSKQPASVERCSPPQLREPLTSGGAEELATMFKAVSDPVRLRLLSLIASHVGGEVCVCDLTDAFDLTQPTVSHHLKVLRSAGLIDRERRGTWVYYWVVPEMFERLAGVLRDARPGLRGESGARTETATVTA